MERDEAIRLLKQHERELRQLGVSALALFGSTARGDARPDSDVDVLIDIEPNRKFSLIDHASVCLFLRELFGRETDVAIRRNLKPFIKEAVLSEAIEVF